MPRFLIVACVFLAACGAPRSRTPYSQEAQELVRACRYDEARPLINARLAQTSGDEHAAALLQLGSLEENAGNLELALTHYRAAFATTKPNTRAQASANQMLGMALVRHRDYGDAIEALSAVIHFRTRPEYGTGVGVGWQTYTAHAVALAETGRLNEAIAQFDLAIRLVAAVRPNAREAALRSWRQAAEDALKRGSKPAQGSFWNVAYGDGAQITGASADFDLVPLSRVAPIYPREALRRGVKGFVEMEVTIDEFGKPTRVDVLATQPAGVFESAAVAAMRQWKFKPRIVDCRPVAGSGVQRIEFTVMDDHSKPSLSESQRPRPVPVPTFPHPEPR